MWPWQKGKKNSRNSTETWKTLQKTLLGPVTKIFTNSAKSEISEYKRTKYLQQEIKNKGDWGIIIPGNPMQIFETSFEGKGMKYECNMRVNVNKM